MFVFDSVSEPLPVLVNPPVPPIAPLRETARPEPTETAPPLAPSAIALSTLVELVMAKAPSLSCTVPVPRLASPAIDRVPPLSTCVPQLWPLLVPDRVKVPPPSSVKVPLPVMLPEKVLLPPLTPTTNWFAPMATVPAPDSRPTTSSAPRVSVAPDVTVTAVLSSSVPLAPVSVSPPASTVVAPVKALEPLSVSVPLPDLVRPPVPLITPE
ncbi:hypothetical protein D3C85_948530 [compost metagenome]